MTKLRYRQAGAILAAGVLAVGLYLGIRHTDGEWTGVDETVVERAAEAAGRPAAKPLINTDQGDLLLLVFLLAGAGGGFVLGYYYRALMGPSGKKNDAPAA